MKATSYLARVLFTALMGAAVLGAISAPRSSSAAEVEPSGPPLFKITVALSMITLETPAGQVPGLIRYILICEGVEITRKTIPQYQVTFDNQPAGYYIVVAQRVDTAGKPIGEAHSKSVLLDEEAERSYEAVAEVIVSAHRQ